MTSGSWRCVLFLLKAASAPKNLLSGATWTIRGDGNSTPKLYRKASHTRNESVFSPHQLPSLMSRLVVFGGSSLIGGRKSSVVTEAIRFPLSLLPCSMRLQRDLLLKPSQSVLPTIQCSWGSFCVLFFEAEFLAAFSQCLTRVSDFRSL